MTRVMYWNLKKFSDNKINSQQAKVVKGRGGLSLDDASFEALLLVLSTINGMQPDILVVGEVATGSGPNPGELITDTAGRAGCETLLDRLRVLDPAAGWRMVPPLLVGHGGYAEGFAVFYKGIIAAAGGVAARARYFTGPNLWDNNQSTPPAAGGGAPVVAVVYPGTLAHAIDDPAVMARQVPLGAASNGNAMEGTLAPRVTFPGLNLAFRRTPYQCDFYETGAVGAFARNISVFAVHTSPKGTAAADMIAMAARPAINAAAVAPDLKIVLGDFNVNLLDPAGAAAPVYAAFTAHAYLALITMPAGVPPAADPRLSAYKAYVATHIKSPKEAAFTSTHATQRPYPGYGYVGAAPRFPNFYSIDNILVQPFNPFHAYRTTIVNPVVGTPYQLQPGPFPNVFNGPLASPAESNWALPGPPMVAPQAAAGVTSNRRSWANYGCIYFVSDHFSVVADV